MLDLVIFDCDGVLVDSEVIACRILADMVAEHVPGLDKARFAVESVGRSDKAVLEATAKEHGVAFPSGMVERVAMATQEALDRDLEPVSGAEAMLGMLELPRAVASNSRVDRVEASLAKTGLRRHFGNDLFGADLVSNPKPAPDLYLMALERTGTAASRAIVVEDSLSGLAAARGAGLRVIGFTGASGVPPEQAERLLANGAELVIDDLLALPALLEEVAARAS